MQAELQSRFNRLEQLKAEAQQHFAMFSDDALNRPPAPEKWGALQHMAHIISSETQSLIYMKKKILGADKAGKSGISEWFRTALLKGFLKTGIKFKAPKVLKEPDLHYSSAELFKQWGELRAEYMDFLMGMDENMAHTRIFKHPMAGRLDPVQALDFMGIHLNRHLRHAQRDLAQKR